MAEYKETSRTLLANVKIGSVTARSRSNIFEQTGAEAIPKSTPVMDIDVGVNQEESYTIAANIKHLLVIGVPEMVTVEFTQGDSTLSYTVRDVFTFTGAFDGTITIKGHGEEYTRCDLIYA